MVSRKWVPRAWRHSSLVCSMPPKARRARRCASSRATPACMYFATSCSKCSRSSSSSSASTFLRWKTARRRKMRSLNTAVLLSTAGHRSFVAQCNHWIDTRRSLRWYPRRGERNNREERGSTRVRESVSSRHSVQEDSRSAPADALGGEELRHRECAERAHCNASECDQECFAKHQRRDSGAGRAERDANADLSGTFRDGIGCHAKHTNDGQHQRQPAKRSQKGDEWPAQRERFGIVNLLLHGFEPPVKLRINRAKPIAQGLCRVAEIGR